MIVTIFVGFSTIAKNMPRLTPNFNTDTRQRGAIKRKKTANRINYIEDQPITLCKSPEVKLQILTCSCRTGCFIMIDKKSELIARARKIPVR